MFLHISSCKITPLTLTTKYVFGCLWYWVALCIFACWVCGCFFLVEVGQNVSIKFGITRLGNWKKRAISDPRFGVCLQQSCRSLPSNWGDEKSNMAASNVCHISSVIGLSSSCNLHRYGLVVPNVTALGKRPGSRWSLFTCLLSIGWFLLSHLPLWNHWFGPRHLAWKGWVNLFE